MDPLHRHSIDVEPTIPVVAVRKANIVVQLDDARLGKRKKYASAHDIRRGVACRLDDHGVLAETLKVIMRHKNFATTEPHYGAVRSAESAAKEIAAKLASNPTASELGGGNKSSPAKC